MTGLRPEHAGGFPDPAREQPAYETTGEIRAAVEQLGDPLNDPLPGRGSAAGRGPGADGRPGTGGVAGSAGAAGSAGSDAASEAHGSPWFHPHAVPQADLQEPPQAWPGPDGAAGRPQPAHLAAPGVPVAPVPPAVPVPPAGRFPEDGPPPPPLHGAGPGPAGRPVRPADGGGPPRPRRALVIANEAATELLPVIGPGPGPAAPPSAPGGPVPPFPHPGGPAAAPAGPAASGPPAAPGGRAARRRAAQAARGTAVGAPASGLDGFPPGGLPVDGLPADSLPVDGLPAGGPAASGVVPEGAGAPPAVPVTPGGRAARRRAARAAQAAAPDASDAPAVPGAPAAPGAPVTDAGTQAPPVVPGGRAARRRAAQEAAGRHGRATGPRDGADGAAAPVVPAASTAFPAPSTPPAPGGAGSLPADAPTAVLPALADPVPSADAARTVPAPPGGGRAARRRARAAGTGASPGPSASAESPSPVPGGRAQARRAARAARGGPAVVASQVAGELFITLGVLMLLFVAYQLWWTNVLALQEAGGRADELQSQWKDKGDKGARDPGAFEPGQGFAIIYIPKLDVKAPIAEGIDKHKVLDKGLVGHYGEAPLETAMPWDEQGNFALAGHRNTHGEPFRYINRLEPGDEIIVETADRYYTYEMASILPQTPPSNVAVIDPVPEQGGFTQPGRYITLTTCTPEFTSTYRMIVWGKMVDERPRSKGKPDALVG